MLKRRNLAINNDDGLTRTMTLYTTVILIMVSFFIILVSKANFDETRYQHALTSIKDTFGQFDGGQSTIGDREGLPADSLGPDSGASLLSTEPEVAQIRALLAPDIVDDGARIIHSKNQKIVSLDAGIIFNRDSTEISQHMGEVLLAFAHIMSQNNVPIVVEGHTDNQSSRASTYHDNWELSSARALAVLEFLIGEGKLAPERLSAVAYAGEKPLYSNASPQGRAKNNRVDLVLDFASLKGKGLDALASQDTRFNYKGFDFVLGTKDGGLDVQP